jgi:hypothetical protein
MEKNGSIVIIAPKVRLTTVFHYKGIEDIPNLIKFVGKAPIINLDMSLQFKKFIIVPDSYVEVNSFGDVVKVIPAGDLEKFYEVREVSEWIDAAENKVIERAPRIPTKDKGKK